METDFEEFINDIDTFHNGIDKYGLNWVNYDKKFDGRTEKTRYKIKYCNRFYWTAEDIDKFNEIIAPIIKWYRAGIIKDIVYTEKGCISKENADTGLMVNQFSCHIEQSAFLQITIITSRVIQITFGPAPKEDLVISGHRAFTEFKTTCEEFGVDLSPYECYYSELSDIKKQISKPHIEILSNTRIDDGRVLEHCYHIDFHSSYGSGLAITHPEFRPVIEKLYNNRLIPGTKSVKLDSNECVEIPNKQFYKAVLTNTIGYMQSNKRRYDLYPILSRDAINNNNERIETVIRRLKRLGYKPLLANTDGVWYQVRIGQSPYRDDMEGDGIGQWSHDYKDCELRVYTKGSYDFRYKENNEWHYEARARGRRCIEAVIPRGEWRWEDEMLSRKDARLIEKWKLDKESGKLIPITDTEYEEMPEGWL